MSARPTANVYSCAEDKVVGSVALPAVFTAPIRNDIVQFVHTNMAKNTRQAYAVNRLAGMNHPAESWHTGRAVARIPRIGHTAAFGNMCRGGRMFAPTKTYRRWHRRINLHQKRFAVVSALAASALPALVMSRGHKIERISEIPFVVDNSVQSFEKTKQAVSFLSAVNAIDDVNRVTDSRQIRTGHGKMRNRRYVSRRGPMLVLPDNKGIRAIRNIFGLDVANVNALNLLHLAPGGHVGRFIIWSQGAFEQLDKIFGTFTQESQVKKGFVLPAPTLTSSDITRIMQSEEVRRVLKPKKLKDKKLSNKIEPTNGIDNFKLRLKLNPFAKREKAAAQSMRNEKNVAARRAAKKKKLASVKKNVEENLKNKGALSPAKKKARDEQKKKNMEAAAAMRKKQAEKLRAEAMAKKEQQDAAEDMLLWASGYGGKLQEQVEKAARMNATEHKEAVKKPPMLGFTLEERNGNKLFVKHMWVGGPAYQVGLRTGDRFISIGGERVYTLEAMRAAVDVHCTVSKFTEVRLQSASRGTFTANVWIMTADEASRGKSYFFDKKHSKMVSRDEKGRENDQPLHVDKY